MKKLSTLHQMVDEKNYNDKIDVSNSSGVGFSSLSNTRRSMLGVSSDDNILNVSDDELHIKNDALKTLFLNILERLDNTDIIMESISKNLNTANNEIKNLNSKNDIANNNRRIKDELYEIHDKIFIWIVES